MVKIKTNIISLSSVILIVMVLLKVIGYIDMNWFWVITSFLWAPFLGYLSIILFVITLLFFVGLLSVLIK